MKRRDRWFRLVLSACALTGAALSPAPDLLPGNLANFEASMVADINKSGDGYPDYLLAVGSEIYFSAKKPGTGVELWRMLADKSPKLWADINPDGNSSPTDLALLGNTLYFSADDGTHGEELWRWNRGNVDGDGNPLLAMLEIHPTGSASPRGMAAYQSELYFAADDGTHGKELWKVANGGSPVFVGDINQHNDDSSNPAWFTPFNGTIYFSANNYWNGTELFKLDGAGNPVLVANINTAGSTGPQYLTVFQNDLYFSGYTEAKGVELYKLNAADDWQLVADIHPTGNSFPRYMTVVDNAMYFSADDGEFGFELWRVNIQRQVEIVDDINIFGNSFPNELKNIGETLYFSANNGENGQELFRLRTDDNAEMIADINIFGHSFPSDLTYLDGVLYFSANDGVNGRELWKFDKKLPPCKLPDTGLSPENALNPPLALMDAYMQDETDILIVIPLLGVQTRIVEVPLQNCEWNLAWLGGWIGYLEGTTFPTLRGNSALTAHNVLHNDEPGPFNRIYDLSYNDPIYIFAWGMKHTYAVVDKQIVSPQNLSVLKEEGKDEITLISCKDYDPNSATYLSRVVIKAILTGIDYADDDDPLLGPISKAAPAEEALLPEAPDNGETPEGE